MAELSVLGLPVPQTMHAVSDSRRDRSDDRSESGSMNGCGPRSPRAPINMWKLVLKLAQLAAADGDMSRSAEHAEVALAQAQRAGSAAGNARARALLATAYEKLGNHILAERHRRGAVDEMRKLGDRRGTAELLLYGASSGRTLMKIAPEVLKEARELAREVGWTEGETRATAAER